MLLVLSAGDPNFGDLSIVGGDLQGTPNQETAIQQHILQRLRTFLGEWFLDNTIGIPFYQSIFVKNPSIGTVNGLFISEIIQTPGVVALTRYAFTANSANRSLDASFTALTSSGVVDYSGALSV